MEDISQNNLSFQDMKLIVDVIGILKEVNIESTVELDCIGNIKSLQIDNDAINMVAEYCNLIDKQGGNICVFFERNRKCVNGTITIYDCNMNQIEYKKPIFFSILEIQKDVNGTDFVVSINGKPMLLLKTEEIFTNLGMEIPYYTTSNIPTLKQGEPYTIQQIVEMYGKQNKVKKIEY